MFQAFSRIGRRRALQGSAAAFVAFGLLLWWLLPLGKSSPDGTVSFSTGSASGVYQLYGTLLQEALAKDMPRLKVELEGSEGSQQNVQRVATGQADFTIAAADAVAKYQREGGRGADLLRGCARLYDDYVHVVVPQSSTVETIGELKGKRVAVGPRGSGVRLIAEHVLAAAGLDLDKDIQPVSVGIGDMPELLESKKIDAFFWSGGLPTKAVSDLSDRTDIRLLQITPDLVKKLHEQGQEAEYYRSAVMPADAYPRAQSGESVQTVAVANLLVTRAGTDAELTEGMTRTVIHSRDRIGEEVHAAQRVDLRTAIYTDPLDLDEGASRYYRSVKP
ncbi:TRAP transporter TAXI family solute receptor [Streptomyces phaeochromogenes]|jgi:TRAP transporter TAXI family solute receptor|uniref:TAXI family TRAP transporter solute-binding subunit n=1 Tax=Streptomyces TaxID=1883 RepID=UPI001180532D|nr:MULTISPECIES: TAXI family TRAP transporter solute-binding subunit [Streptomyces]MDQ0949153.1 TRAP transporter TAXI family solute receptor [Streptomyces phaeochromogenes]TRO62917.1 TAXI family TRAP transporter solute-binding subunit [Streptomyces sp. IB201691-2A2]